MKLRLRNNFVRLRLTRGEVALFKESGAVEEHVEFQNDVRFVYRLISDENAADLSARFDKDGITVVVPASTGKIWTTSEQVGLEGINATEGGDLKILIEKDFTCLDPRPGGEDEDTFPNPSKCAS